MILKEVEHTGSRIKTVVLLHHHGPEALQQRDNEGNIRLSHFGILKNHTLEQLKNKLSDQDKSK